MRNGLLILLLALYTGGSLAQAPSISDKDWPAYGGDAGGQRYSVHNQINATNVDSLQVAWTFHTGALQNVSNPFSNIRANFEATPVLWHDMLFFDTPFDEIFALNASTGKKIWSYDPAIDRNQNIYIVTSRGVALWRARRPVAGVCGQERVFVATLDRRLIARDARTGQACEGFGDHGTVDLAAGMGLSSVALRLYGFTSPPTVVGDIVVLGSSIGDNQTIEAPSGMVRGFTAITGRLVWSWEPLPWAASTHPRAGSGNAWSIISADPERDMIYLPTGSPSTDYYGGFRPGDNRDADSIVALKASTGQRVWAFQLVHHDLWDYDTPSEPLLFTFRKTIPAVAVTTKTGMIFVFNRITGEPLYPIIERPVPQSNLPGEKTWPTQPFSTLPTLTPLSFGPQDLTIDDPAERAACAKQLTEVINNGIFSPPALKNTLLYPGPLGGANWGSPGIDPVTGILYVHTNSLAYSMRQIPKASSFLEKAERYVERLIPPSFSNEMPDALSKYKTPDSGEFSGQDGAPYQLFRGSFNTPKGTPCSPQPWGALVAVNLNTGTKSWVTPQGTNIPGKQTGSIGLGGPVVTAGGLVFIGATSEPLLRAFDSRSGKQLWEASLPAAANATPMTYQVYGRQFVVVAAGGEGMLGNPQNDAVVAFALPAGKKVSKQSATPIIKARGAVNLSGAR